MRLGCRPPRATGNHYALSCHSPSRRPSPASSPGQLAGRTSTPAPIVAGRRHRERHAYHAPLAVAYRHVCRWCGREERHADDAQRYCPVCVRKEREGLPARGRKLMALPVPRRVRFHDLRHTTASLLLAAGADLYAVARILRHTDPKLTFDVYAHLVPGYLEGAIARLKLG